MIAYDLRISDWSSDVCSSDLFVAEVRQSSQHDGLQRVEVITRPGFLVHVSWNTKKRKEGLNLMQGGGWVVCYVQPPVNRVKPALLSKIIDIGNKQTGVVLLRVGQQELESATSN